MGEFDCLELVGRHAPSMDPAVVLGVCVHHAHPSREEVHRLNSVTLLARGKGLQAHLLFSDDSRDLAANLVAVAAVAAGEWPELDLVSPAGEMRAAGLPEDMVAEAEYLRCYVMFTDTGVNVAVAAHLPHDGASEPGHDLPCVQVKMQKEDGSVPELDVVIAPADAGPLAASLLKAADKVSPAADPRYRALGLAGCLKPAGIHYDWRGEDAIAVTAHRAHGPCDDGHQPATVSMHLIPAVPGKRVTVTMPAADTRELVGVLGKAVQLADSAEATSEHVGSSPAGEVAGQDNSLVRADVRFGHEDAGEGRYKQMLVDLFLRPGGTSPQDAGIGLSVPEADRLTVSLERALGTLADQTPG